MFEHHTLRLRGMWRGVLGVVQGKIKVTKQEWLSRNMVTRITLVGYYHQWNSAYSPKKSVEGVCQAQDPPCAVVKATCGMQYHNKTWRDIVAARA